MKVGELILKLRVMDPDSIVILSKDAEGNVFSPLPIDGIEIGYYESENGWSGEFYPKIEYENEDWDMSIDKSVPCVTLFPTN